MLKFAISGSHGTGKSTLVSALADAHPAVRMLPEVPRLICEESGDPTFFRRADNSFSRQLLLVSRQIADEAVAHKGDSGWLVTDRSVADHWAYTEALFPVETASEVGHQFHSIVHRWMRTYRRVFMLRPEFDVIDDGVREDDREFQRAIDEAIRSGLTSSGVPVTVVFGTVSDRVQTVLTQIQQESTEVPYAAP